MIPASSKCLMVGNLRLTGKEIILKTIKMAKLTYRIIVRFINLPSSSLQAMNEDIITAKLSGQGINRNYAHYLAYAYRLSVGFSILIVIPRKNNLDTYFDHKNYF